MCDPYEKWARFYNLLVEPLLRPLKREIVRECSRSGLNRVLDIGSGTGTLRSIVRELLPNHSLVKSFRPGERGEGGNGVTIAQL